MISDERKKDHDSQCQMLGQWEKRKTTKYSVILNPIIDLCVQCPWSDVVRMSDCSRLKNKKESGDSLIKKERLNIVTYLASRKRYKINRKLYFWGAQLKFSGWASLGGIHLFNWRTSQEREFENICEVVQAYYLSQLPCKISIWVYLQVQ